MPVTPTCKWAQTYLRVSWEWAKGLNSFLPSAPSLVPTWVDFPLMNVLVGIRGLGRFQEFALNFLHNSQVGEGKLSKGNQFPVLAWGLTHLKLSSCFSISQTEQSGVDLWWWQWYLCCDQTKSAKLGGPWKGDWGTWGKVLLYLCRARVNTEYVVTKIITRE